MQLISTRRGLTHQEEIALLFDALTENASDGEHEWLADMRDRALAMRPGWKDWVDGYIAARSGSGSMSGELAAALRHWLAGCVDRVSPAKLCDV